ncbi:MAG: hypothetical protein PVJ67_07080, partial [Candidatus Pacearchaeota archaeon]
MVDCERGMVYKKYIKKNGKVYGPYIYHSRRVEGKVVSNYHGKGKSSFNFLNYKNYFFIFLGIVLIIFGFLFFNNLLTGKATLNIDSDFVEGEILEGTLKLTLVQGEFLPGNTMVTAKIGNHSYTSSLDKLIVGEKIVGDYFIEDKSLSGRGGGFGYGDEYPKVSFVLDVYLKDEYSKDEEFGRGSDFANETEIIVNETFSNETEANLTEGANETIFENETIETFNETEVEEAISEEQNETEEVNEEISNDSFEIVEEIGGNVVSEEELESETQETEGSDNEEFEEEIIEPTITGGVIKSFLKLSNSFFGLAGNVVLGKEIEGEVSYGSPYIYNLTARQTAKIISSTEKVKLKIHNDGAVVTTEYKGPEEKEFSIDLEKLNITAGEGELEIKFVYSDIEILSINKKIGNAEILEGNLTEVNVSEGNLTLINETVMNETIVLDNATLEINTTQYTAVINKPVRWKKNVKGNFSGEVIVNLPKEADNIIVYSINDEDFEDGLTIESEVDKKNKDEKNKSKKDKEKVSDEKITITGKIVTGEISADLDLKEEKTFFGFFKKIFNFLTGRVIEIQETTEVKEVKIAENATEFEIEYETPAPMSIEENILNGKEITISSEFHYQNVLAYTELPKEVSESEIKLYHIVNGSRMLTGFNSYDENNNSLVDYIEWVVPHLSNQTYELIIEITKAEHLDSDRNFISDIYEEVRAKDNVWSETINDGEYVRITFEHELDSSRDITVFARSANNESSEISVYTMDGNESIATFENINEEHLYKIYLTNLTESEDVFDLRVGGNVEFDYIVDPITFFNITTPQNNSVIHDIYQDINYTYTDEGDVDSCWYTNDSGA